MSTAKYLFLYLVARGGWLICAVLLIMLVG